MILNEVVLYANWRCWRAQLFSMRSPLNGRVYWLGRVEIRPGHSVDCFARTREDVRTMLQRSVEVAARSGIA